MTHASEPTGTEHVPLVTMRVLLGLATGGLVVIGLFEGGGGAVWPSAIDAFGVSKGLFGAAASVGLLLSFPVLLFGSRIVGRFDTRLLLAVFSAFLACAALGLSVGSGAALMVGLLAIRGISLTAIDLAANSLAMGIELRTGRHIMSPMHAGFSGGALLGAALGWLVFAFGGDHSAQFLLLGGLFLILTVASVLDMRREPRLSMGDADSGSVFAVFRLFKRADIRAFSALSFVSFAAELLLVQWIGIFLVDELGYDDRVGAWAVMLLMATMFVVRIVNGPLTERIGALTSLFLQGGIITIAGLAIILTSSQWVVLAGCGLAGIGLAGMAPTVLHLAGKAVPEDAGGASGATLIGGYAGVALLPSVAGFIADQFSVRTTLTIETLGGVIVLGVAFWLRQSGSTAMAMPSSATASAPNA